MASNPLIDQGTLNRIRASITIPNYPALNVTSPFTGKAGISLQLEGDSTIYIPTMTGACTSPEPYQLCNVTIGLLRTQNLANLYKLQMENDTRIGPITVRPDAATLGDYPIQNVAIQSVRELPMNGTDAGFVVILRGYYLINNNLWNLS